MHYVRVYVYVCVCMYVCIVCMCVCVCAYVYACVCVFAVLKGNAWPSSPIYIPGMIHMHMHIGFVEDVCHHHSRF